MSLLIRYEKFQTFDDETVYIKVVYTFNELTIFMVKQFGFTWKGKIKTTIIMK